MHFRAAWYDATCFSNILHEENIACNKGVLFNNAFEQTSNSSLTYGTPLHNWDMCPESVHH